MPTRGVILPRDELAKRGGLAIALAAVANLLVYHVAEAVLSIPPTFQPMHPARVVVLTVLGGLGAVGAYVIVQNKADDPPRTFVNVAMVALVVSFIPDILLLVTDRPGTTIAGVVTLMTMHIVAAVTLVAGLTWGNLGQPRPLAPHER